VKRRFRLGGVRHGGRPTILTARRRRVLEDARAEKRRLNPARGQRRNYGKLNRRNGGSDERRMSSMIIITRRNHRRCAAVLDATRVRVDALMQLRGSTQRKRPEKPYGNKRCDKGASVFI